MVGAEPWLGMKAGAGAIGGAAGKAATCPVPGAAGRRCPQSWQKIDPSRFTRPHCWQRAIFYRSTFRAQATRGTGAMPKLRGHARGAIGRKAIDRELLLC
jgi:hypothetical protein